MNPVINNAFNKPAETVLQELDSLKTGLSVDEAAKRLSRYGRNSLPQAKPPGLLLIFFSQFTSPLIYVLLAAAVLSLAIGEYSDAGFITAVLMINAIIGATNKSQSGMRPWTY